MIYKTKDFECPKAHIMLYVSYNDITKEVLFQNAKGYFYPQDSRHSVECTNADEFIKQFSTKVNSIEEANAYLQSLTITESFN